MISLFFFYCVLKSQAVIINSGTESDGVESLTATFTQKLEELKARNSRDENRLLNHPKYEELTNLLTDRGSVGESSLRRN